jgi:hypothetical protein
MTKSGFSRNLGSETNSGKYRVWADERGVRCNCVREQCAFHRYSNLIDEVSELPPKRVGPLSQNYGHWGMRFRCDYSASCFGGLTQGHDNLTAQHHHNHRQIRHIWRLWCIWRTWNASDGRTQVKYIAGREKARVVGPCSGRYVRPHLKQLYLMVEINAQLQCNHNRPRLSIIRAKSGTGSSLYCPRRLSSNLYDSAPKDTTRSLSRDMLP